MNKGENKNGNDRKRLTILVQCFDSIGRFNASFGLTIPLRKRGHRVIYVTPKRYDEKIRSAGFETFIGAGGVSKVDEKNLGETFAKTLLTAGLIGPKSTFEKMQICIKGFRMSDKSEKREYTVCDDFNRAFSELKPDLLILDQSPLPPTAHYGGAPWIRYISTNPLIELLGKDNDLGLPPGGSGYPCDGSNRDEWQAFFDLSYEGRHSPQYNDYLERSGYARYPDDVSSPWSEAMTVYAIPEELNYPQIRAKPWHNIEVFAKDDSNETAKTETNAIIEGLLPAKFLSDTLDGRWSGKWIYLSLGSMGSVDIDLMRRLLKMVAGSRHKFIVSKGPRHAEYEIESRNAWGDRYLPQIAIIRHVDLVITHAGNNTLTEVFSRGKPMIALPMFWDQYDNAQRLHETGYGVRLDPYRVEERELNDTIDRLLGDDRLQQSLQKAAQRIQSSNAIDEVCDKIEKMVEKHQNKSLTANADTK